MKVRQSSNAAIAYVNNLPPPLSLYPFSSNSSTIEKIVGSCNAGNVVANDVLMNMIVEDLPFGGVGPSGLGSYHGLHSLYTFTRPQAFMHRQIYTDLPNAIRYPNVTGAFGSKMFIFSRWFTSVSFPGPLERAGRKAFGAIGGMQSIGVVIAFVSGAVFAIYSKL